MFFEYILLNDLQRVLIIIGEDGRNHIVTHLTSRIARIRGENHGQPLRSDVFLITTEI